MAMTKGILVLNDDANIGVRWNKINQPYQWYAVISSPSYPQIIDSGT